MRRLFLKLVFGLFFFPTFIYAQTKYPKYSMYVSIGANFPVGDFAKHSGDATINGYAKNGFAGALGIRRNIEKFSMGVEYAFAFNNRMDPFIQQTAGNIKPGFAWREPRSYGASGWGWGGDQNPGDTTGKVFHHSFMVMGYYGVKPNAKSKHQLEFGLGAGLMLEEIDPLNKVAYRVGSDTTYSLYQNTYQFTGLIFKGVLSWNIYLNRYFNLSIPINFAISKIKVKNDNYDFNRSIEFVRGSRTSETINMPNSSHMVSYWSITPTLILFVKPISFSWLWQHRKKKLSKETN